MRKKKATKKATSKKRLRERWSEGKWAKLTAFKRHLPNRIDNLLKASEFEKLARALRGLPHAEEVPGYIDLRGVPLSASSDVDGAPWPALDMSYAQTDHWLSAAGWDKLRLGPFAIKGATIVGSRLANTAFDLGYEVIFEDCDLSGTKIQGRRVDDCRFLDCDLSKATLKVRANRCVFARCDFTGANLKRTVFRDCDLSGSDFREAKFDSYTTFWNVRFDEPPRFDSEALALVNLEEAPALRRLLRGGYAPPVRRRSATDDEAFLRAEGVLDSNGEIDMQNQPI